GGRGAGRVSARVRTPCMRASARLRRSIATGRTAWASAEKATSRVRPWWPHRRSWDTWRRRASSGCNGIRRNSVSDTADTSDTSDTMESMESHRAVADSIGVPVARRHIFLCCDQTKPKCCDKERGLAAWDFLKHRLKELGLSEQG